MPNFQTPISLLLTLFCVPEVYKKKLKRCCKNSWNAKKLTPGSRECPAEVCCIYANSSFSVAKKPTKQKTVLTQRGSKLRYFFREHSFFSSALIEKFTIGPPQTKNLLANC